MAEYTAMAESVPSPSVVTAFLANSNARCPACRYALRGCTSDKCPECGCELALEIASTGGARTSTWWFASIGGCALAALLSIILLVSLLDGVVRVLRNPWLAQNVRSGFMPATELPHWARIFTVVAINAMVILLAAWVIAHRRAFEQWSPQRRTWIGLVCWLSPAIVLGLVAWLTS